MDNLELIKIIKKPAAEIMKDKGILASLTISSALHYLNSVSNEAADQLIKANNVMKRKAGKKYNEDSITISGEEGKFKSYDSLEDCIRDWLLGFRSSNIKEIWDFDTAINRLQNKEFTKANLQPFVDAYKLKDIDNKVLEEIYPPNQSVVEVDSNPIAKTAAYQQMAGYKPKTPATAPVKKKKKEPIPNKPVSFTKGSKFTVRATNIFYGPNTTTATRCYTGNVWLYDGIRRNNRYAITTVKDFVGKGHDYIEGYIKASDLR